MKALRHLAILSILGLCSCAATFGGGPFDVSVDSYPAGASITYRGKVVGTTPATIRMHQDSPWITLSKSGYQTRDAEVGRISNGHYVLAGTLWTGPIELIITAATNTWSRIDTRPVNVHLAPRGKPQLPAWRRER